jgi:hypothetical protein
MVMAAGKTSTYSVYVCHLLFGKSNRSRNCEFINRFISDNSHDPDIKKLPPNEHKKYVNERQEARPETEYIKMNIVSVKAVNYTLKVLLPISEGQSHKIYKNVVRY